MTGKNGLWLDCFDPVGQNDQQQKKEKIQKKNKSVAEALIMIEHVWNTVSSLTRSTDLGVLKRETWVKYHSNSNLVLVKPGMSEHLH